MGVMDSFFIMFEADASGLNDGLDEAKKKTNTLEDNLKKADKAGDNLGKSFANLLATAGGALAATLSFGAMAAGIKQSADYADRLGEVADMIGVNIEALDAWGRATQMAGGSAEGFQSSLSNLSSDFAMISTKGTSRTLPFFKELGISLKDAQGKMRGVMDVLPELADKFEKMSKQESLGMGRKLGLDEGTIMLLQRGRREVDDMLKKQKELGVITKEQAEIAGEFNDSLDLMGMAFRGLFLSVGQSVLPAFKWVTDNITKLVGFFRKHSDFMTGLFIALGVAIMTFLVPPLITAGAAAIAAFSPFLIMGAIVGALSVAFALLYDDVMNFISGNDSMIGEISKKYPMIGEVVKGIVASLEMLWTTASAVFGLLTDLIIDPMNAWTNFVNAIYAGLDAMSQKFPNFFNALADGAKQIMGVIDGVKDFFGFGDSDINVAKTSISSDINAAKTSISKANASPLNGTNSSVISNSKEIAQNSNVSIGKVEIKTKATDSEGIARSVGGHLQAEVKRATSQYDNGVVA